MIKKNYRRTRTSASILEAKFEAQKLAFAPLSFQAAKSLRDLKILETLNDAKKIGLTAESISKKLNLSFYTVSTLLEVGNSLKLVKRNDNQKYILTKIGYFILEDQLTKINMDFINDICYQGAFYLQESFIKEKPIGLKKIFGNWKTVYQGLFNLPKKAKKSWFSFDHYYSDLAFDEVMPILFEHTPETLFDIGGNTGKLAAKCLLQDPNVKIKIIDLPSQIKQIKTSIKKKLDTRITSHPMDLLDSRCSFPEEKADIIWMSQFLDCFSLEQIVFILKRISSVMKPDGYVYILELFWDLQKYPAAEFSLTHASLYFTCIANGNSKFYSYKDMKECIYAADMIVDKVFYDIGENNHTLIRCKLNHK